MTAWTYCTSFARSWFPAARRESCRQAFVAAQIAAAAQPISRERQSFELRPLAERHHVIQLSAWLLSLAGMDIRLAAAWRNGAVRYNNLTREFPDPPDWYRALTDACRGPRKIARTVVSVDLIRAEVQPGRRLCDGPGGC